MLYVLNCIMHPKSGVHVHALALLCGNMQLMCPVATSGSECYIWLKKALSLQALRAIGYQSDKSGESK